MASNESFIYPLDSFTLTQDWGVRPEYYKKYSQKGHNGLDLKTSLNTPVKAAAAGVVKFAGNGKYLPYVGSIAGNYVLIDHGDIWTGYAHNNSLSVTTGDHVSQGQEIAKAGKTGDASGVHVHFEFIIPANPVTNKNGFYGRDNPHNYMIKKGGNSMPNENEVKDFAKNYTGEDATPADIAFYTVRPWSEMAMNIMDGMLKRIRPQNNEIIAIFDNYLGSKATAKEINYYNVRPWQVLFNDVANSLKNKGGTTITREEVLKYIQGNLK